MNSPASINYLMKVLNHIPTNDRYSSIRNNLKQCVIRQSSVRNCIDLGLCLLCGNKFSDLEKKITLEPPKKMNRFLRRLSKNQLTCTTKYQIESVKKLKKKFRQTMVKRCENCTFKRNRKVMRDKQKRKVYIEADNSGLKRSAKKKKNKKDAFAGLDSSVVQTIKRARELLNSDIITPKRPRLDPNVIVLDTPANSSESSNVIELDTPAKTSENNDSNNTKLNNVIFELDDSVVCIDKTSTNIGVESEPENPDFISLITPNTSIIDLATPVAKKSNKKTGKRKKKDKNNKNSDIVTPTLAEKKSNKKGKNSRKNFSLSNLLKEDNRLNKTVSNLELFLNSVSKK